MVHELDSTNKTVRQIALELNFSRADYLAVAFQRVFTTAPLKYRASMHPRGANRQLYGRDNRIWPNPRRHAIPSRHPVGRA